jgi:hypothetical protein
MIEIDGVSPLKYGISWFFSFHYGICQRNHGFPVPFPEELPHSPHGRVAQGTELQQLELPEESGPVARATHHTEASMSVWIEHHWLHPSDHSQIKPHTHTHIHIISYIYTPTIMQITMG